MFDLRHPLARGIFLAATLIIGFFLFFPIYWLVISALKPNGELYRIIPTAFPHEFSVQHFVTAVTKGNLPQQLKNSLIASTHERVAQHDARRLRGLQLRQVSLCADGAA